MIRIGTVLHGFCGGMFDVDYYSTRRVEAMGADWVVARTESGDVHFAACPPEFLEEYAKPSRSHSCCEECLKLDQ